MQRRRHLDQTRSLKDRLATFANEALDKASHLPPGPERDELLKRARRAETASHIDEWANSPALQQPNRMLGRNQ